MGLEAAVVEERERRRIATGLHDSVGQALALAQLKLSSVRTEVADSARAVIEEALTLIAQSAAEMSTLIFELSPPVYDLGLDESLCWLGEDVERRYGLKVDVAVDDADKPLEEVAQALVFRSIRELLTNVSKHANCRECSVSVRRIGDEIQFEVRDGGAGFDVYGADTEPATHGFGLASIREQITRLGGQFAVASAIGKGTRATFRVPLKRGKPKR